MWNLYFCYALYEQKEKKLTKSLNLYKNCLKVIEKKFDKSHISIAKVKLQYTTALFESK